MDKCVHCGAEFEKTKHNQVYCTDEHRRLATNERIMRRYYERKAKRIQRDRRCACGTILSKYNVDDACAACSVDMSIDNLKVLELIVNQS